MTDSLRTIELFCGAGGLALGFHQAGYAHAGLYEWNKDACQTVRLNAGLGVGGYRDWTVHQGDVREVTFLPWREKVSVVAGGPPCQPFSIGGKHKAYDDSRDMFPQAARCVAEVLPEAFVFENVKGLTRRSFLTYFQYIVLSLSHPLESRRPGEDWLTHLSRLERIHTRGGSGEAHYRVVARVLNAADYGVPQRRERVFFVGMRADLGAEWSFPLPTHSEDELLRAKWVTGEYWEEHRVPRKARPAPPAGLAARVGRLSNGDFFPGRRWRTVRDALVGLPAPGSKAGAAFHNHFQQPGARPYVGHTGSPLDEPAKTLKAGDHGVPGGENMLLLPDGSVRYFSVRESARLQTFPDEVRFEGSWSEAMRQLGNAVPVKLGEAVAASVTSSLRAAGALFRE